MWFCVLPLFHKRLNATVKNWRQPFVKRASRPENVDGGRSWPDWDIQIAGELTPSVRLRIVALFLMGCLLHFSRVAYEGQFLFLRHLCIFAAIFFPRRPRAGAVSIPTGLNHSAQGWPRSGLPWVTVQNNFQPQRGCIGGGRERIQPLQGCIPLFGKPRVARASQPWAE